MNEESPIDYYNITGYHPLVFRNRGTRGGGVAFFVFEIYTVVRNIDLSNLELLSVDIKLNGTYIYTCTVVYNEQNENKNIFVNKFNDCLSNCNKVNHLICGDFNIDLLSRADDVQSYKDLINCNGFEMKKK